MSELQYTEVKITDVGKAWKAKSGQKFQSIEGVFNTGEMVLLKYSDKKDKKAFPYEAGDIVNLGLGEAAKDTKTGEPFYWLSPAQIIEKTGTSQVENTAKVEDEAAGHIERFKELMGGKVIEDVPATGKEKPAEKKKEVEEKQSVSERIIRGTDAVLKELGYAQADRIGIIQTILKAKL